MAIDTVSSLIFTGPLAWTNEAACVGQTDLFFAPALVPISPTSSYTMDLRFFLPFKELT